MANPFARYGLFFSLLYITVSLIFYLTKPALLFDMFAFWCWMLLLFVFMWVAVLEKKNADKGIITLRDGVKQAWLTFVIGLGVTYLFQYLLTNLIESGVLNIQKEMQTKSLENVARLIGISEDKSQKQFEIMEERGPTDFSRLVFRYATLLVFGAIPSFIMAAIMKKEPLNTTT